MLDAWCVRLGTAIVRILLLYRLRRPKLTPAYLISMGRTSLAGSERWCNPAAGRLANPQSIGRHRSRLCSFGSRPGWHPHSMRSEHHRTVTPPTTHGRVYLLTDAWRPLCHCVLYQRRRLEERVRFIAAPTRQRAGGSVAEWLACWTQAQYGPGSNRSCDAVG